MYHSIVVAIQETNIYQNISHSMDIEMYFNHASSGYFVVIDKIFFFSVATKNHLDNCNRIAIDK
jgi:hypothetical protein